MMLFPSLYISDPMDFVLVGLLSFCFHRSSRELIGAMEPVFCYPFSSTTRTDERVRACCRVSKFIFFWNKPGRTRRHFISLKAVYMSDGIYPCKNTSVEVCIKGQCLPEWSIRIFARNRISSHRAEEIKWFPANVHVFFRSLWFKRVS